MGWYKNKMWSLFFPESNFNFVIQHQYKCCFKLDVYVIPQKNGRQRPISNSQEIDLILFRAHPRPVSSQVQAISKIIFPKRLCKPSFLVKHKASPTHIHSFLWSIARILMVPSVHHVAHLWLLSIEKRVELLIPSAFWLDWDKIISFLW